MKKRVFPGLLLMEREGEEVRLDVDVRCQNPGYKIQDEPFVS